MQSQLPLPGFDSTPRHDVQRLFFALWPDAALRQRIDETTRRLATTQATGGRRMSPERYHLTLQFLGDFEPLPPSLVDAAMAAADEVRASGFLMPLQRAGSFGGARVGWLGPEGLSTPLQDLWSALEVALARHGVKSRSPASFSPHVTILRDMRRPLPAIPVPALAWMVDGFVLIRSQPGHGAYTVLRRWPLEP